MPKGLIAIETAGPDESSPWAPKEAVLLPVANRPLVHHALEAMRRAGAAEVIVASQTTTADAIREALPDELEDVHFLEFHEPPTAAGALLAAAPMLEGQRVLMHLVEGLLVRGHGALAAALADESVDATVFFHDDRAAAPPATKLALREAAASVGAEPRLAGIHIFGPTLVAALAELPGAKAGRVRLADAVECVAEAGGRVNAGVLDGWWRDRRTPQDLLEVNRRVLDELGPPSTFPQDLATARLEGRVHVHPTAQVRDAVVRGPAIIGAHAHVTDAYVGPYTSVGDGATIENAEIACSMVLPRARIRHVGVRVEDSIVGPGASVGRDFALPKTMRLLVGGEAQVMLA